MRTKLWLIILGIIVLSVLAGIVDWPKGPDLDLNFLGIKYHKELKIVRGLDLQGGTHLTYEGDVSKIAEKDRDKAMESLKNTIEKRINAFGVIEPNIYTSKIGDKKRLAIELPGVKDVNQAIQLIGQTAQLEFKEQIGGEKETTEESLKSTGLTGKHLTRADVTFNQNTGESQVSLVFNSEGTKLFGEITSRNVGEPVAIYLDNKLISAPRVNEAITSGEAVITGKFNLDEAKRLAIQLNAGALPVPINLVEQRTIGATLGQESIQKSLYAGIIGIIFVSIIMIICYHLMGVFSTIGLGLYLLFVIALIKLFGITLTMGGIAGLILSVGMSMETDVLVFERIREELRNGKSFVMSVPLGFQRAWPSIRDSNAVSLIICALLYTAGGTIRGFAVVLAFGIVIGLLTTFLGTRTLFELFMKFKTFQNYWLFSVEKKEESL